MYKVRVYDKDGNRRYSDPLNPGDYDAAFSSYQAADRYVAYKESQGLGCVIMHERDLTDGMPSAQPTTLYGYNIEHLDLIARVLDKEGLPPERVTEALTDMARIVAIVKDEFEETLQKSVQNVERRFE